MVFHLSTYNPSGLKDYLIQMVKRNISYRRLYALYHVSFDVYKGEVIGIIGTNGSGKSTLLKIVSGALRPTSGSITVDRKKVQLLTLGTGFDMELTARENVYLNGSIIGYSKDFLDKHYNDIVKFAELEDFMEEKVKNFSSGMVSRLGFAIATAGDAAEILILDEVLSVGDEFFRKKSLARIKEMIHCGSTVLIVSHGMNTILENCTRCVWIEKGELRMVGNPKEVCDAYRHMEQNEGAVGA
ncbi:MAG: ABC transporter ATP-binding protein [Lachnospiraceae bacterium]|nr:ABC transporter ATP-binding protein [Lachnospiraceae bacterium]